jgi:ABC-type lipoprotein release transport system permease subunit
VIKSLVKNRFKTFLIFISIMVSVMAIFLITAISSGIISMYSNMIKTDGDIIVTQKGIADTFFSDVDRSLLDRINEIPHVKKAYGVTVAASPVSHIPIAGVYGVTANHLDHYRLVSGKYPEQGEVLLGRTLAKNLHGRTVKIANKRFRVSGVYSSEIGFEEGGVVMHIEDAEPLFNRSASFLLVMSDNPAATDMIIETIRNMETTVDVKPTDTFIKEYNQFKIIERSSWVISGFAFFLGLMGVASVMSMVVTTRKEEFGIMRALGKSRLFIAGRLFVETLTISSVAYTAALVLSLAILWYLPRIELLQGYVSGELTVVGMVSVFVATLVMSLAGAMLPAWFASKTDPILLIRQGCS